MTERPFIADAREAKGLHDGSISLLVRVVDPQPDTSTFPDPSRPIEFRRCPVLGLTHKPSEWGVYFKGAPSAAVPIYGYSCPFGVPGDRLWVRERWAQIGTPHGPRVIHSGERVGALLDAIFEDEETGEGIDWQPAETMHRESCRTLLDVTDVRVIQVQEVPREDMLACMGPHPGQYIPEARDMIHVGDTFRTLWPKAFWDANASLWLGTVARVGQNKPLAPKPVDA